MDKPRQLSLFSHNTPIDNTNNPTYSGRELGTFKDSMKAPVFRWFRYPAGYSYKFVFESFDLFHIKTGDWVYDPFSGTGTTLLAARQKGINGYGVEAHKFVHWVADVKLNWSFKPHQLEQDVNHLLGLLVSFVTSNQAKTEVQDIFPELIYKCYHPHDLVELYLMREFILTWEDDSGLRELAKLALTDTLRGAAIAQTGWPYIKPKKHPEKYPPKNALHVFSTTFQQMKDDLLSVLTQDYPSTQINTLGDARQKQVLEDEQIGLAITSPPYLNNYDYADRTRLETYFWGITNTWREITTQFRDELLVAATTQIRRGDYDIHTVLSAQIKAIDTHTYTQLQSAVLSLSEKRRHKPGKKSYDLMTALYFNGIVEMLKESYRVIRTGGHFCLVLGDSAPYGVHIPTDDYIGQLALGIGFSDYQYHQLRTRGGKWRDNPQRHTIPLREGIVILTK